LGKCNEATYSGVVVDMKTEMAVVDFAKVAIVAQADVVVFVVVVVIVAAAAAAAI
jgi:hypothetical protein